MKKTPQRFRHFAQRCKLRDRSVAAATASMKAERTARDSRARMPAAGVPAGDVMMASERLGILAGLLSRVAEPSMVSTTRVRLTSRVSPGHARLHERLGDQEG